MKAIIFVIGIAILLGIGAFWLYAKPAPAAPQTAAQQSEPKSIPKAIQTATSTFSAATDSVSQASTTANILAATTASTSASHVIDGTGVVPSEIVAGSAQPLTFTALISDPVVITSSVNLVQVKPDGSSVVLATLQPAGNGTFTLRTTALAFSFPTGTLNLRISAAFSGTLKRVQSPSFTLQIDPATDTSSWTSVSPSSQGLFTMKLPPGWQITGGASSDGYDSYLFVINDTDGIPVATIFAYTPQQWADAQYLEAVPVMFAQGNGFIFAEADSEAAGPNWYSEGLGPQLVQALATFQP